jgi:hypothetical protein
MERDVKDSPCNGHFFAFALHVGILARWTRRGKRMRDEMRWLAKAWWLEELVPPRSKEFLLDLERPTMPSSF